MVDEKNKKLFDEGSAIELKRTVQVLTSVLAIPLFLAFWIHDILSSPQFKWPFLFIRLLIIPITLISGYLIKKNHDYQKLQIISLFYAVGTAGIINAMTIYAGNTDTISYVGLILVSIGALSFVPFSNFFYALATLGIFGPYYFFCFAHMQTPEDSQQLFLNSFFIVGAITISNVIRHFNQRMLFSELMLTENLKNELDSRAEIIKKQSLEAAKLHQLSSQFSPQVVEAIRGGQLKLDDELHRTEICAIFIDIVKSTEKVVRLPEQKVQATLARFLDTVMAIFLKYDLTIDKFHGDGVLAFSNSPVKYNDYIERVCKAALEAREALAADREFYILNWKSEMQIRIGISAGVANVGFYGDKKFFKTFSAIGVPLPFASRLTSLAEPGQILIDSEIAEVLTKNNFLLKNLGEKNIKGFEEDINIVFELLNSENQHVQKAV